MWTATSSAGRSADITPNDDTDLSEVTNKGIYIGVGGDINLILEGDSTSHVFKNTGDGRILPLRVKRVLATGTTATNIKGLYD